MGCRSMYEVQRMNQGIQQPRGKKAQQGPDNVKRKDPRRDRKRKRPSKGMAVVPIVVSAFNGSGGGKMPEKSKEIGWRGKPRGSEDAVPKSSRRTGTGTFRLG